MKMKLLPAVIAALIATAIPAGAAGYRVVDLTPAGALESSAAAANGGFEAGDITIGSYSQMCGPRVHCFGKQTHASIWSGTSPSFLDLGPKGYFTSTATGIGGRLQVGYGFATQPITSGQQHALVWAGSAKSMVDLHPKQYRDSAAYATDGAAEVGSGVVSGDYKFQQYLHALLWFGSAATVVDLNPTGSTSEAFAVASGHEFGYAAASGNNQHAYSWAGSAASAVDLNPAGHSSSVIQGVDGKFEIGTAAETSKYNYYYLHAYLWSGNTNKGVDLNPVICDRSYGQAVRGGKQVGWGSSPTFNAHALLWSGTAASYVDLNRFLPTGLNKASVAYAIDRNGTIAGIAVDNNDKSHAVLWIPR